MSRIFNPTWEQLETEWNAIPEDQRDDYLSMVANRRTDFEFATALGTLYSCTAEEAREHGAPQAVLNIIGTSDGVVDLAFDQPNTLGQGGVIANHPTLGWFVVTPNANPNTERPIIYRPDVRPEVFAYAFCRVMFPCCRAMCNQLHYHCDQHGNDCPDRVVRHSAFPEPEGRWVLVAENAAWDFNFCPWCAAKFQEPIPPPSGSRLLFSPKG